MEHILTRPQALPVARVLTPATPAYRQSVDQFRNYLVEGKLTPGEVLPGSFRHFTFAPSAPQGLYRIEPSVLHCPGIALPIRSSSKVFFFLVFPGELTKLYRVTWV